MPTRQEVRDRRRRRHLWHRNAAAQLAPKSSTRKKRKLNLEALEPRLLLTTLFGGETFTYVAADPLNPNAPGQTVVISLEGNIVAEFIAADIDDQNQALIGDISGTITASSLGRGGLRILGGTGGLDGVTPIGTTQISDPISGNDITSIPSGDINLSNLATRVGFGVTETYSLNVGSVPVGATNQTVVQVANMDYFNPNATNDAVVVSDLHQANLDDDIMSNLIDGLGAPLTLDNVGATAVDPTTGLLYAIDNSGVSGAAELYRINRFSGVSLLIGTITNIEPGLNNPILNIESMAIDDAGDLYFMTMDFDGDIGTDTSGAPVDPPEEQGGVVITPRSPTDPGIVNLGDADFTLGTFDNGDVDQVRVQVEGQLVEPGGLSSPIGAFTGGAFSAAGLYYVASQVNDDQGQPVGTELHRLNPFGGGGTVQMFNRGEIDAAGTTIIEGLAFVNTYSLAGGTVEQLVGIDHSDVVNGVTQPKMVAINTTDATQSALLGLPGTIETVFSLASYQEPGSVRELLFSINDDELIRGSAVTLPLTEDGAIDIEEIKASTFNPLDGLMYFVVPTGDNEADRLFRIDISLEGSTEIQNSIELLPGTFGESNNQDRDITSISFDQVSGTNATLWAFDAVTGRMLSSNWAGGTVNTSAIANQVEVEFRGQLITSISGIEFPFDNPNAAEEFVMGIDNDGADSQLLRIRLANDADETNIYSFGPLPDPDDNAGPRRGENLTGLTFNSELISPFTGEPGVFLATDQTSDEIVFVDTRARFPNADLYSVYVTQSDETGAIRVSVFDPTTGNLEPFEGNVVEPLQFAVLHAVTRQQIVVTQNDATGGALLGTRTEDINPNLPPPVREDLIPILTAGIDLAIQDGIRDSRQIGVRPGGFDEVLGPDDIAAGFVSTPSLLNYMSQAFDLSLRTVGGNIDNITEMATSRDGAIFVIDSDGVGLFGGLLDGVELASVDPATGNILNYYGQIIDNLTGLPVTNVQGLDFGDINFDGQEGFVDITTGSGEDFYAIFDIDSPIPEINIGDLGLNRVITALAATSDGNLFAVENDGGVFEFLQIGRNNVTGNVQAPVSVGDLRLFDNTSVIDIVAMDIDPQNGNIYAVGDPGTGNQTLLRIFETSRDLDSDLLAEEALANPVGELTLDGALITEQLTSIAFNPANGNLYAVLHDEGNPATVLDDADYLYLVDVTTGALTRASGDPISPTEEVESLLEGNGLRGTALVDGNLNAVAVSVDNLNDIIYAVSDNGVGGFDLIQIDRNGPTGEVNEVTNLGTMLDGVDTLIDIHSMDYDTLNNRMLVVAATDVDNNLHVYSINLATAAATDLGALELEVNGPAMNANNFDFTGLAFNPNDNTLYGAMRTLDLQGVPVDFLVDLTFNAGDVIVNPVVPNASNIQVGIQRASIEGMEFTSDFRLIAYDDSQVARRLIEIDLAEPDNATVLQIGANPQVVGLTSDNASVFYGIQDNFAIGVDDVLLKTGGHRIEIVNGGGAIAPSVSVGGDLGADLDVVDVAINQFNSDTFIVVDDGGSFSLREIIRGGAAREVTAVNVIGTISSGANVVDLGGADFNPNTDEIYMVGTDGTANLALFSVDPATAVATRLGDLDLDGFGGRFDTTDFTVAGVSYDDANDQLYVVLHDTLTDDELLYQIDTVANAFGNVTVTEVGEVLIGNNQSQIATMDFDSNGVLKAIDDSHIGGRRVIQINVFNPAATLPLTNPNLTAVDANLQGYAADANGNYFGIANPGGNDTLNITFNTTAIQGMDFSQFGGLFGISDPSGLFPNAQMITINFNDPTQSREQGGPGSVPEGFGGYTSDAAGIYYSVDTLLNPSTVFASEGAQPALGTLNPDTNEFNVLARLDSNFVDEVQAIAFYPGEGNIPGQQGLYILGTLGNQPQRLMELNPETGDIVGDVSPIVDALGAPVILQSMDFNRAGQLFGYDQFNGQLLDIALNPALFGGGANVIAGQTTATDVGSIAATVDAIAFDFISNRFIAADNSTGAAFLGGPDPINNPAGFESIDPLAGGAPFEAATLFFLNGTQNSSVEGQVVADFMFAGTVIGNVNHAGSFGRFYAGWLLTGNTLGEDLPNQIAPFGPSIVDNFFVAGDLRELIVGETAGSDIAGNTYLTGLDVTVGGKVGQVWTLEDFVGEIEALNDLRIENLRVTRMTQSEIEVRRASPVDLAAESVFLSGGLFRRDDVFYNDSFDTAQQLGTLRSGIDGEPDSILLLGTVENTPIGLDEVDYYSMGLIAGQTITIQMVPGLPGLNLGIFDPDGRLVASDYDNLGLSTNEVFQFTVERPGEHRFAVGLSSNPTFVPVGTVVPTTIPYQLIIEDTGDIAIGGVRVDNNFINRGIDPIDSVFNIGSGDFGAFRATTGAFASAAIQDILIGTGNLRSFDAFNMGPLNATIQSGHIGLLQSRGPGVANFNSITVGGDLQSVNVPVGTTYIDLTANGGLGTIRTAFMDTAATNIITVDADNFGQDGIIDLIDVTVGDFGSIPAGGPQITTGPGGNVRYIRVAGTVYQDSLFGGNPAFTVFGVEDGFNFVDDSGASYSLHPVTADPLNQDVLNADPATALRMAARTYGIRSGGSVLVDVLSTGSLELTRANSHGVGGSIEIGSVYLGVADDLTEDGDGNFVPDFLNWTFTEGRAIIDDPAQGLILDPTDTRPDIRLFIDGNEPVNIFNVVGNNISSIVNRTPGEIVGVQSAGTIGSIVSNGSIGVAKSHTGAEVVAGDRGVALENVDFFPFNQRFHGVIAGSHIQSIVSDTSVGNIVSIAGNIDFISANDNGDNNTGEFEGIAGPIFAGSFLETVNDGNVRQIQIGEGILPSGTGNLSRAGIFVSGRVESIGSRVPSIVMGDIVAARGFDVMALRDGVIINNEIFVTYDPDDTLEWNGGIDARDNVFDSINLPVLEIGHIGLSGPNSGIIGASIYGADIGKVVVDDGFGIVNTAIGANDDGRLFNVTADGLGLRSVTASAGTVGHIVATGRGEILDTNTFNTAVRLSEKFEFHPLSGQLLNENYDIHAYLGTMPGFTAAEGITNAGVLEGISILGSGDINTVEGYRIIERLLEPSVINFANKINVIRTYDYINGLEVTTGEIRSFDPRSDVFGLLMNISGDINRIHIRGDLGDFSEINALGPNGSIGNVTVEGNVNGSITAAGNIGNVDIRGDLNGTIEVDGRIAKSYALNSLRLYGDFVDGGLTINGDVNMIDVRGSLGGEDGQEDLVVINGNLNSMRVGSDTRRDGADLAADLIVLGDLRSLDVTGKISGNVSVTGDVGNVRITADSLTGTQQPWIPSFSIGQIYEGNAIDFDIQAMAVTPTFDLFAVDRSDAGYSLYDFVRNADGTLNTASPETFNRLGEIYDATNNASVFDIQSMDANPITGDLTVLGRSANMLIPTVDVGGDLGADFTIAGLATDEDNDITYAIVDAGGTFELRTVDRDVTGAVTGTTLIGTVSSGIITIDDITAMDYDHVNERVLILGTGGAADFELFGVNITTATVTSLGFPSTDGINGFSSADFEVRGIAYNDGGTPSIAQSIDDTVFVVLRDIAGNQDQLMSVTLNGQAIADTSLGLVQIEGVDTDIAGMDLRDGKLLAFDDSAGPRRLISIDLADATNSRVIASGAVSGTLEGFAVDGNGDILSIDNTGGNDLLFSPLNWLSQYTVAQTAVNLDADADLEVSATEDFIVTEISGGVVPVTDDAVAIAWSPDGLDLFVVRDVAGEHQLHTINTGTLTLAPVNGLMNQIMIDGSQSTILGMDFNDAGELVAIDTTPIFLEDGTPIQGKLIEIDITDPTASTDITEEGTVSLNLRGYTIDPNNFTYSGNDGDSITNELWRSDVNLLDSRINIGGGLRSLQVRGGHLGGLGVAVGGHVGNVQIQDGDLAQGAFVSSALGDIGNFQIRNGDIDGSIRAPRGSINSIQGSGNADIGSTSVIEALYLKNLRVDGSMLENNAEGAEINITHALGNVTIGGDVVSRASITAGSLSQLRVNGDFDGTMTFDNETARRAMVTIGQDFTGQAEIDGDVRFSVGFDFTSTAMLSVGGDLEDLTVRGTGASVGELAGDVFVDGMIKNIRAVDIDDAVITAKFDIARIQSTTIRDTLIQAGLGRGEDGIFDTGDFGEGSRLGSIGQIQATDIANSIIAAGGDIDRVQVRNTTMETSISSGYSVGVSSIDDIVNSVLNLSNAAHRDAVRGDAGREVLTGDIKAVSLGEMTNVQVTAGIDPGANGIFEAGVDDSILTSSTGGESHIAGIRGTLSGADTSSIAIADGLIKDQANGAIPLSATFVDGNNPANYFATLFAANPLELTVLPVVNNTFTFATAGGTMTVRLTGPGTLAAYDDAGTANVLDTITLSGTTRSSQLRITTTDAAGGAVGRLITDNNSTLNMVDLRDIDIVGDGVAGSKDVWIDGELNQFKLRGFGVNVDTTVTDPTFDASFGGDVKRFDIELLGTGKARIGGHIQQAMIDESFGQTLFSTISVAPIPPLSSELLEITTNDTSQTFIFDGAAGIAEINPDTGAIVDAPDAVVDLLTQQQLLLNGLDYDAASGNYLATAEMFSYIPSTKIGGFDAGQVQMSAIAVQTLIDDDNDGVPDDRIVAVLTADTTDDGIYNPDTDQLVEIDRETGAITLIGTISDLFNRRFNGHVQELAFDRDGNLYGLITDRDGYGTTFDETDGAVLVLLESTDFDNDDFVLAMNPLLPSQPFVELELDGDILDALAGNGTEFAFTGGMAVNDTNQIFAAIRDEATNQDILVTIGLNGLVNRVGPGTGAIQVGGTDTNLIGIGFDDQGNLLGYNNDGVSAEMVVIGGQQIRFSHVEDDAVDNSFDNAVDVDAITGMALQGNTFTVNASIGDNTTVVDDLDVYQLDNVLVGETITVSVSALEDSFVDPIVGIYNSAGVLIALNDNGGVGLNATLTITAPLNDSYYVVVTGAPPAGAMPNPFVVTNFNTRSVGDYRMSFSVDGPDPSLSVIASTGSALDTTFDAFGLGFGDGQFNSYAYDFDDILGGNFVTNTSNLMPLPASGVPANIIGSDLAGGGLGADYDVVDVAVSSLTDPLSGEQRVFFLNQNGPGVELYEISRAGNANSVSMVEQVTPGNSFTTVSTAIGTEIHNLKGISSLANGTLVGIGTLGNTTASQLIRINPADSVAANDPLLRGNNFVTEDFIGIAVQPLTQVIYAVREGNNGSQILTRVDVATLQVTDIGEIEVGGLDAEIEGIAFDEDGRLIGIDNSNGGRRTIVINTITPLFSSEASKRGGFNDNLVGLGADDDGRLFSLYDNNIFDTQLWGSPIDNRAVTLGSVDPSTGEFLQMRSLAADAAGTPLNSTVQSLAVDNSGTGNMFVVTADDRLFEYTTNGAFVSAHGFIRDAGTNIKLDITSIDFDEVTGQLVGMDARLNRLVAINTTTASAIALTNSGAFNVTNISDIDFDPTVAAERFIAINNNTDSIVQFSGTSEANLGGLEAYGIKQFTGGTRGGSFDGRITIHGNERLQLRIDGDFDGSISTQGDINNAQIRGGQYTGTVRATGDINSFQLSDVDVLPGGTIQTEGKINSFRTSRGGNFNGDFNGRLLADSANSIGITGFTLDAADISIENHANSVQFGKAFEGSASFGSVNSLQARGLFGTSASVDVTEDARSVNIGGDMQTGSHFAVGSNVNSFNVRGDLSSQISIDGSANSIQIGSLTNGLVAVGTSARNIQTRGHMINSVISIGVTLGADNTYNTEDDTIIGGSAQNVRVGRNFQDSVVAVGVLPNIDAVAHANTPNLPTYLEGYFGYNDVTPNGVTTLVDDAEAGGILPSDLKSFQVGGFVIQSDTSGVTGRVSGVASAGEIGRIQGRNTDLMSVREYTDQYGAPLVVGVAPVNNSAFEIVFTEELNTSSLILSQDLNGDNDVTDVSDIQGTIEIRDQQNQIVDEGIEIAYTTRVDPQTGVVQGVARFIAQGGFGQDNLTIRISGGGEFGDQTAVFDRSGGRSFFRDFNIDGNPDGLEEAFGGNSSTIFTEDPFGTIFDGNEDGIEGGDGFFASFFTDMPDTFAEAITDFLPIPLAYTPGVGFDRFSANNTFATIDDIDIFRFTANPFDFFSVEYDGNADARIGIFVQDPNTGLATTPGLDDKFELIVRHESSIESPNAPLFQAIELPGADLISLANPAPLNYFVVVTLDPFGFSDPDGTDDYSIHFTLAESDDMLDGIRNNQVELPVDEQIGYFSNVERENNNLLGANLAKQLVYLNFGGGVSTAIHGNVPFDPFDSSVLDPALTGFEDTIIEGATIGFQTITGVVENVLTVYSNTPLSHPNGQLNVQRVGSNLRAFQNATEGLFFTTIDPELSGLDPDQDFATVFIGDSLAGDPGVYGIAEHVDFANLDKGDQAYVLTSTFRGESSALSINDRLNEYSLALANVIAHELGHLLGMNHSGALDPIFNRLYPHDPAVPPADSDDPDNNIFTPDDSNIGIGIMGAGTTASPTELTDSLMELGTAPIVFDEFPIGDIDTVDQMLRWLK